MIKFGVYKLSKALEKTQFKGFWGGEKKISISLYNDLPETAEGLHLEERILKYFADIRGAYKRTYRERFKEFDRMVLKIMSDRFDFGESVLVDDLAVSNAMTSCDFFYGISEKFSSVNFFASDLDPYVYVVDFGSKKLSFSSGGELLEVVFPPFVFNLKKRDSYFYLLNHLAWILVKKFWVTPKTKAYRSGLLYKRRIELVSKNARALARNDQRFVLTQRDILQAAGRDRIVHVVRAMNILNPSYLTAEELRLALGNIFTELREGGLLVLGSNEGGGTVVNGAVFQKSGEGFAEIWRSGDGPVGEIEKAIKLPFNGRAN